MVTSTYVGPFERLGAIQRRLDLGRVVAHLHDPLHGPLGEIQPLGVNVHQGDSGIFQQGKGQHIAHQIARKAKTAGANKGNLCHFMLSFV